MDGLCKQTSCAAANETVDAIQQALSSPRAVDVAARPAILQSALLTANVDVFERESSQGVLSGCTASFVWLWEAPYESGNGFVDGTFVHVGIRESIRWTAVEPIFRRPTTRKEP